MSSIPFMMWHIAEVQVAAYHWEDMANVCTHQLRLTILSVDAFPSFLSGKLTPWPSQCSRWPEICPVQWMTVHVPFYRQMWFIDCLFTVHIYVLNICYTSTPPLPYVQAHSLGMTYPRYMFLTYGWYGDRLLAEEVQGDECTLTQRKSVLLYTLAVIQEEFLTNLSAITDTGIVSWHFLWT